MAGVTNRGKYLIIQSFFRNTGAPTSIYAALITSTTAPTPDTNTMSDVSEIAAGNGYTSGGAALSRNATDFDVLTEDDTNDKALIQAKDIVWTASGGPVPASGSGARYMLWIDDNVTVASRQVIAYFSLTSDRTVSDGQSLTIQNAELDLTE